MPTENIVIPTEADAVELRLQSGGTRVSLLVGRKTAGFSTRILRILARNDNFVASIEILNPLK